jgi:phosphoribosylformylglycinamidine cyclo-ligase
VVAKAGWAYDRDVPELGRTLGEELLTPTRIYARACLELARTDGVHAMAHVTGGGLASNLARVLPEELTATLERRTWTPAPVFDLVRRLGDVPQLDLEATLNCGVGMVALLDPRVVDEAIALLGGHGIHAWVAGEVGAAGAAAGAGGTVELVGQHPGW